MLYLKKKKLSHIVCAIFIYILIIPILLLDFFIEVYHRICFPIYKFNYIKRKNYIQIDRQKLNYLNWFQKLNCVYCGYANGVIHYWSKIAGETERYWCGIQHQKNKNFIPLPHQKNFSEYGNEQEFIKKYKN